MKFRSLILVAALPLVVVTLTIWLRRFAPPTAPALRDFPVSPVASAANVPVTRPELAPASRGAAWVEPSRDASPAPRPDSRALEEVYPTLAAKGLTQRALQDAASITLTVVADAPLVFQRREVREEGGWTIWTGAHEMLPGSSLVTVAGPHGTATSTLILPGLSQFAIHTERDGRTLVEEFHPGEESCGVEPVQPARTAAETPIAATYFDPVTETREISPSVIRTSSPDAPPTPTSPGPGGSAPPQPPPTPNWPGHYLDVLFLYTPEARAYATERSADPVAFLEGRYRSYLESGNTVLSNSQIPGVRWRFAGLIAAHESIGTTNDATQHLGRMNNLGETFGRWLTDRRVEFAADQAVVVHHSASGPTGIANNGSGNAVPLANCAILAGASYKVLVHELAHNLGCGHDRANAPAPGPGNNPAQDGDGRHHYGQLWRLDLPPDPTRPQPTAGTIMSYAAQILPYFSHPEISVHVNDASTEANSGLDFGVRALGVPLGEPRAAFNVKVIVDNAPAIAAMQAEITAPPVITTHPSAQAVSANALLTLSVSANGGGLTYQWRKDGNPIVGATSATFTKTATTADAGNYSVMVTNRLGAVTSESALVTVSAASSGGGTPPSTPSSGGNAGGGGGGGSPSAFALAALLVVLALRRK